MKRIIKLSFILVFGLFISCNDTAQVHKTISGRPGELIVVIPNSLWNDSVGAHLQSYLQTEHVALPQPEPLFDVVNIPPTAFSNIFKTNRSIITVDINPNDSAKVTLKHNVWAAPQNVVEIKARTADELNQLISNNGDRITDFMIKGERKRLQKSYKSFPNSEIRADIINKFGVDIVLPMGYKTASNKENFYWARFDNPKITQSVMVYSFPYTDVQQLSATYLIMERDSIMKKHVETPLENSYMLTEPLVAPSYSAGELSNGIYIAEIRGLWRLEGDFMGGSFITIAAVSPQKDRVVVIDAWLYAPDSDKRNFMRQLEAILYSMNFSEGME